MATRQFHPRQRLHSGSANLIYDIIEKHEQQFKVFEMYNLVRGGEETYATGKSIFHLMKATMNSVLRVDLESYYLADASAFYTLCAAFFGKKKPMYLLGLTSCAVYAKTSFDCSGLTNGTSSFEAIDSLPACEFPMHAAILAAYAADSMAKRFAENHDDAMEKHYEKIRNNFESRAVNMLDALFLHSSRIALIALEVDYRGATVRFALAKELRSRREASYVCRNLNRIQKHLLKAISRSDDIQPKEFTCCNDGCVGYTSFAKRRTTNSIELMAIAYKADARKFLSHPACQLLVERRWMGNPSGTHAKRRKTFVVPWNLLKDVNKKKKKWCDEDGQLYPQTVQLLAIKSRPEHSSASSPCDNGANLKLGSVNRSVVGSLCSSIFDLLVVYLTYYFGTTNAKLVWHTIFRFVYVFVYARMLMMKSRESFVVQFPYQYWEEIVVGSVQTCQLLSAITFVVNMMEDRRELLPGEAVTCECFARFVKACNDYFSHKKRALARNLIIFISFILIAITVCRLVIASAKSNSWQGGWGVCVAAMELTIYLSFALATLSTMRFLNAFHFFAFFTVLIENMIETLIKFLLLFLVFWVVLAVSHISLSENYNNSNDSLVFMMFNVGAFEIFGEVESDDKSGSSAGCSTRSWREWREMELHETRCLLRSTLIPVIVFSYMLVASIVLVNLLTAQLSKEYEEQSKECSLYFGYKKYDQLSTYENKLALPPPLSLIYYVLRFVGFCIQSVLRLLSYCCCVCFGSNFQLIVKACRWVSTKYWSFLRVFEGLPWGSVRQIDAHSEEDEADAFKRMRTAVNQAQEDVVAYVRKILDDFPPVDEKFVNDNDNQYTRAGKLQDRLLNACEDYQKSLYDRLQASRGNSRAHTLTNENSASAPANMVKRDSLQLPTLHERGHLARLTSLDSFDSTPSDMSEGYATPTPLGDTPCFQ